MKNLKVSNYRISGKEEDNEVKKRILSTERLQALSAIINPKELSTIELVGSNSLDLEQENELKSKLSLTSSEFTIPYKSTRLFFTEENTKEKGLSNATILSVKERADHKVLETYEMDNSNNVKLISTLPLSDKVLENYDKGIRASEERYNNQNENGEKITLQSVIDGCMPGGYFWCGKACGYQTGSTKLKNKIDGCCQIHDYCYTQYKTNRCTNCDRALVNCVQNPINKATDPNTADLIKVYFNNYCKFFG